MITLKSTGSFNRTYKYLDSALNLVNSSVLDRYGKKGVSALKEATPKDSGKTADSWYYIIKRTKSYSSIIWANSNVHNHVNIAIILQYGHGTRNGGWVQGRDYINPAIQPIFDEMANKLWEEVTSL